MALIRRLSQIAYGGLFTIVLPVFLATWAWRLDQSGMTFWPIPFERWAGETIAAFGLTLMAVSVLALWFVGKGLPMNAFPPPRFVPNWTYAVVGHPIYVGFVMAVGGIAIIARSPAGLWVVTPVVALASIALVLGYEGPRLRQRFPATLSHTPVLGIPPADEAFAPLWRRWAAGSIALGPWAVLYSVFALMPEPSGAVELRMAWEWSLAPQAWMTWLYGAAYPAVIASPLMLRNNAQLRRFVIGAWMASAIGLGIILAFPARAEMLTAANDGLTGSLLLANRALDAPWLAAPSFHALWMVFAAYCFRIRFPRLQILWVTLAAAVCLSCVMTGSHAVIDVLAGVGLGVLAWNSGRIWLWLVQHAEKLSNSWNSVEIGPVRVINHAVWSADAASVGMAIVLSLAGPQTALESALVFGTGLLSAGAWGYWLEGGERLSRPFGYYGFVLGAGASLLVLGLFQRESAQVLMAAFSTGAPAAQAIGRLRCLVQGCCHGRPVSGAAGIRVLHPCSRVTALGQLHGVVIHPTQLYSIASNAVIFAALLRLWQVGVASSFLAGMYLVLSSLARFVEEEYRGEPQTQRPLGMAVYQWLSIALFVAGIVLTMTPGVVLAASCRIDRDAALIAVAAGMIAAAFMSVDFPGSTRRFSRLTVNPRR